jgi:hypothetical protein
MTSARLEAFPIMVFLTLARSFEILEYSHGRWTEIR